MAVVALASSCWRGKIGNIVAVSATLPPAVTILQIDEAGAVGGGALVEVNATARC